MLRDDAMVGGAHGGSARTPQPGAPAARAPIEVAQPAQGTVIDRLTSIHNGRLGNLLNQLQILGVDKMHLNRIKAQLTTALGDDSGKQFRVLQKAIEQLVKDKSLGVDLNPLVEEHDDSYKPEDLERLASKAKTVTTYVPDGRMHSVQQGECKAIEEEGPRHRTPLTAQGDQAPVMMDGSLVSVQEVMEHSKEALAGRPMLGAGVMKDAFDFLGDTQIDVEDKPRPPSLFVPAVSTGGPPEKKETHKRSNSGRSSPLQTTDRNTPLQAATKESKGEVKEADKLKKRKKKQGSAFKTLNNALYHPHEDHKGLEMRNRIGLARGGPGRFNEAQQQNGGTAPMPGTAFWACMLLTGTDEKKAGSCGDNHKGGLKYAVLYTNLDGYVYRGSLGKDEAIEWISRMHLRHSKNMMAFKAYTPLKDEPKWVRRKPDTNFGGNEAIAIMDESELRAAFSEANSNIVTLWQVYIRGPGSYSQICRVVHDFTGMAEDSGHYMLSCTHEMGSRQSHTAGYFVDSNDIQGTKAQGRATIINNVLFAGWASHVDTAVHLAHYAHTVFPYRRKASGAYTQKLPKFSPEFVVMDFLVARDGSWHFSNVVVLRSHRNMKELKPSKNAENQMSFGPDLACNYLENSFMAVQNSLTENMTRRFGPESRPNPGADYLRDGSFEQTATTNTLQGSKTVVSKGLQRSNSSASLGSLGSVKDGTRPSTSPSRQGTMSQMSFSLSKKQVFQPEKSQPFDPLNQNYDRMSDSEGSNDDASGSSMLMASKVSQVGITRRMPRPKSAMPMFTGILTMEKVNHLACNPRMQASGSRVLKEILVARSRAESVGMAPQDDVSSRVWTALKRRISAVALSDPRARNPVNEPALRMRLGATTVVGVEDGAGKDGGGDSFALPHANKSTLAESRRGEVKGDASKGSRRPATAKPPRVPEMKSSDMKNAVKSAAAALGHPI